MCTSKCYDTKQIKSIKDNNEREVQGSVLLLTKILMGSVPMSMKSLVSTTMRLLITGFPLCLSGSPSSFTEK